MLGHIARFEFRYHWLSPAFIAITLIIGLFSFGIAAAPQISVTLSDAVNTNSPQEIMIVTSVFGLFGMVIPAVFLASARAAYITGIAFPVDGGRVKHLL